MEEYLMRLYSSFLIRRWQLDPADDRIEVVHLQSGRSVRVASLAEAGRWMEGLPPQEGGAETPIWRISFGDSTDAG